MKVTKEATLSNYQFGRHHLEWGFESDWPSLKESLNVITSMLNILKSHGAKCGSKLRITIEVL